MELQVHQAGLHPNCTISPFQLLLNEKAEAMMEEVEQLVTVPEGIATSSAAMSTTVAAPALVTPTMSQNSADSQ